MSLIKANEFRGLGAGELDEKKTSLQKQMHELRQKKITGQLDKPHFFKQLRRQIAQIETIKRESKNVK